MVDMVLLEGGFLFVGLHVGQADGLIKVWNTATGAEQSLPGPKVGVGVSFAIYARLMLEQCDVPAFLSECTAPHLP